MEGTGPSISFECGRFASQDAQPARIDAVLPVTNVNPLDVTGTTILQMIHLVKGEI